MYRLDPVVAQMILQHYGRYDGDLDGYIGFKSISGVDAVLHEHGDKKLTDLPLDRRIAAAVQVLLNKAGFEAGDVDGWYGNQTDNAVHAWSASPNKRTPADYSAIMKDGTKPPLRNPREEDPSLKFPLQSEMAKFYGKPGPDIESQLVTFTAPYAMILGYDPSTKITKMRLHKKCAETFEATLLDVRNKIGLEDIIRLKLNVYDGGYMHRKMRGGTAWSTHAYGAATDFLAALNGNMVRAPTALFSQPAYREFMDIMESRGLVSLGREIDRDYMHFQAARYR